MTEPTNETLHDAELQKAPDAAKAEAKPVATDESEHGGGLQGLSIGEF